jgi:glutamyl-tRNA synthetase
MALSSLQPSSVITRFAPSPTGYLHIGGARTALFNWLYAKAMGGQFLIRIEDTDRERSTPEAVEAIFKGLDWLGLNTDAEIIFQSQREDRHKAVVEQLLSTNHAYACFMGPEETEAAREQARLRGQALRSPWRDKIPDTNLLNTPHVVRFKTPLDEPLVIDDVVQGQVVFNTKDLDDLVLLRSDGTPTYNLAVVVDDHDMGITHIIRGDDHLNNAARQSLIYKAAGWTLPRFAHIPLIHGEDGAKLSKRHGAQAVGDYEAMGYLPEAMRNYLARLGWSHGDDEIFTDKDAIEWFDISDINKAPSRLDFAKLNHVNAHWIRACEAERLINLVKAQNPELDEDILRRTLPLVKERAQTLPQLLDACAFALAKRPFQLDEKTKLLLNEDTKNRLIRLHENLLSLDPWETADLEVFFKKFVENEGISFGKLGPALRGIISGGHPAPDISRSLVALGKAESLMRLKEALFN